MMSETRTFLLEIGVEEMPASYLEPAVSALSEEIGKSLAEAGASFGEKKKMWTPRRLSLIIADVATESAARQEERQGPPAKVAKDENGKWTVAAKKFAESMGVKESSLFIKETEKGNYVCVKRKTGGEPTRDTLSRLLPGILGNLPFSKNMKWPQSAGVSFARPVRWLCALLGNEIIEFEFAGVRSSNITCGHRFAHPESIAIDNPDEYVQKLHDAYVLVGREERRSAVIKELSGMAKELGGEVVSNEDLAEEVTDLVEYPKALDCRLGGFIDLPREVLATALAKHQRAFVVEKEGKLLPYFLVVTNAPGLEPKLARPWFERMAISRLEDADFFIKEDLEKGLDALVKEEVRVEWIKGIGSLAQKTEWLKELGSHIGKSIPDFNRSVHERAAYLSKADLLSNLVREKEFTSLQGIAGAIYAERLKEHPAVSAAIREQYTDSPSTLEGAALGIADRLLNIAATFIRGKPPKGSSDPYAVRRQATAIIKMLVDKKIHANIKDTLSHALVLLGKQEDALLDQLRKFLEDRLELYLKDLGFAYDWVDAVAAVAGHDPYDAWLRLSAFSELHKTEEFKLVAVGQKRVANITKALEHALVPSPERFTEETERVLWSEVLRIKPELQSACESRIYRKALELLLSIRPAIDKFFDDVFVMVEDEGLRMNRLSLLNAVKQEFLRVADFSKIVAEQ
ncbi:glycine--tRNA ligase subunit beta [bacterium]|nr:glycine--tRNA ligase subunit beta [bacterium]